MQSFPDSDKLEMDIDARTKYLQFRFDILQGNTSLFLAQIRVIEFS